MKRFGILAMVLFLLSACQEEISWNERYESGLPASLDLELSVPSGQKIAITRGVADAESVINELVIFMASGDNIQHVVDLTGKLTSISTTENGGRTYKLQAPITTDAAGKEILSGTYTIYSVANSGSEFCNLNKAELLGFTKVSELTAALAENKSNTTVLSTALPMSGKEENVEILPIESDNSATTTAPDGNKLSLHLRRLTAHVEFIFANGQNDENPKFVPTSYSIYNLPQNAKVISSDNNTLSSNSYQNIENIEIAGSAIEFFMLENPQEYNSNCTSYGLRDAWDNGSQAAPTKPSDKNFTHAPEDGTFIVVTGEYSGKSYFGSISYTIHLGNFSGTDSDYSKSGYGNFSVNRNEHHTYKVTVNGVKSIVTESDVKNDDTVPGAEGELTVVTDKMQFVLDAHYETVMLSFGLTDECANPSIIVNTPYTNGAEQYELASDDLTNVDCHWIHFMAPSSTDALPKYDNKKTCGIADFAAELKSYYESKVRPENAHFIVQDGTVYTTAFIDEYFYEDKDWTTFVNTENRLLVLNPEAQVSADGNTTLYPDYIFSIAQRSIKTTYVLDSGLNAFGIETWNETGKTKFTSADHKTSYGNASFQQNANTNQDSNFYLDYDALTFGNGWENTHKLLTEATVADWTQGAWLNENSLSTMGYLGAVSDNTKESHVFYSSGEGVAASTGVYGFNACLTRNRDENNDGKISDGELKWYLPAMEQYHNLWLGIEYLTDDTQLFDPTLLSGSYVNSEQNFFSSSTWDARLLWAAEGCSYGKIEDNTTYAEQSIRCVRNLKTYNAEPARLSSNDEAQSVISVNASPLTLRATTMTGEYAAGHTERSDDNRVPAAFEVALVDLGEDVPVEPVYVPEKTTTWMYPGSDISVKFDCEEESWIWTTYYYTFTISFTFTGVPGATYTCDDATCTNTGDQWTVTYTTSRSAASNSSKTFSIVSTLNGNTGTVSVATSWSNDGQTNAGEGIVGTGTISYKDYETTTGGYYESDGVLDGANVTINVSTILTDDLCADNYYQNADKSDLGQWRIPNQREMMLMIQWGYLDCTVHATDAGTNTNLIHYHASRTFFTNNSLNNGSISSYPFVYHGQGFTIGEGNHLNVRCVRDAQDVDGSGSTGGSGTGGSEVVPED